ncbi:MAG: hypothetical protein V1884_02485 [Candidatus Omnitrophota bacterium]
MRKPEFILVILMISASLILYLFVDRGFCDTAGNPYTAEPSGSIGAWYDETWQASGYYRLERIGSSDNFRYEYTTTPTTASNPTFKKAGSLQDRETEIAGGHKHDYEDATSGASIPQDIVVTEWKATGHVHFAASQ